MFGLEKPKFRDAFETEILGNLTRRYGSISNADADALEKECLYYATDMCLEFQAKSGGFLPKDWRDHIFNEVCAVFDKHFSGKYNKAICEIQHIALMGSLDFAKEKVQKYYNRP